MRDGTRKPNRLRMHGSNQPIINNKDVGMTMFNVTQCVDRL